MSKARRVLRVLTAIRVIQASEVPKARKEIKVNTPDSRLFLKHDGSTFMTGDLNMNENRVKNMLDPSEEQDTVNKRFLEARPDDYFSRKGKMK